MSMPIQRQSESFGIFDDGPRYARDRSDHDLPQGLADLVNSMGPRIQGGMLNTRTAANEDELAELDREHHEREFPNGDHTEGVYPSDDDHDGSYWPGKKSSRTAGWHVPDYDPRVDGYPDEDLDRPTAADFAEEDYYRTRGRSHRHQGPPDATDFDPYHDPDRFIPEGDVDPRTAAARRRAQAGPDDGEWKERDLPDERFPEDEWGHPDFDYRKIDHEGHTGSRHPFDRTAACQSCGEQVLPEGGDWSHVKSDLDSDHHAVPDDDDVDNDEYGEGRDPALAHDEYEHRLLSEARLAGWADDNPSWDETMKNIDDTLAGGEPEDKSDYGTDYYHNGYERGYHGGDGQEDPYDRRRGWEDEPPHPDKDWEQTPDYHIEQHHKVKDGRHALVEEDENRGGWTWSHFDGDPFGASFPNAWGNVPTREQAFQAGDDALSQPSGDGSWSTMRHHGYDPMDQGDPRTYQGDPEFANIHHPNYPEYMRQRGLQPRTAGWADDNPDHDDVMRRIDEQLAAGEPEDTSDHSTDYHADDGLEPWERELVDAHDQAHYRYHPEYGSHVGGQPVCANCGEESTTDDDGYCDDCGHQYSPEDDGDSYRHRTAEVAVDPAVQQQMAVPVAGGYQPAHRVGLPWRDTVIPGTVIGLDGQNVGVRWDDGQYSTEEPHNIKLL